MSAKIAKALHEVMTKVSYVQKGGVNKFHGYRYAGEADLLAVLRPAMIDAGLLLLPSVVECRPVDEHGNTTVIMEYTLAHKDGEVWPDKIRIAGTGHDKTKSGVQDKGTYKAITGANKYLLFKLFQIETGDDPEHDEKSPGNGRHEDPIAEAKRTAVTEDAHLLVNGETRSMYEADKAANGGKTAYMRGKEKEIYEWLNAAHKELPTVRDVEEWWDAPERHKKIEWMRKNMPEQFNELWLAAERRIAQLKPVEEYRA